MQFTIQNNNIMFNHLLSKCLLCGILTKDVHSEGYAFSPSFTISTDVEQGENISPILFNVYLNDLSVSILEEEGRIGNIFFNRSSYELIIGSRKRVMCIFMMCNIYIK